MMFPFPSAQFLKQDCQERQMSSQEKVMAEVLDEESAENSRNRTAAILATFFMVAPFGVRSLNGTPIFTGAAGGSRRSILVWADEVPGTPQSSPVRVLPS